MRGAAAIPCVPKIIDDHLGTVGGVFYDLNAIGIFAA
jgi:hypothetical protein